MNHPTTQEMAEEIAKGKPCPSCLMPWYYFSDPKRGSVLNHAQGCLYIQLIDNDDDDTFRVR